jgi:hypothetical protein
MKNNNHYLINKKMVFSLYLENFVKGLGKTTGGVFVLFAVYPLFVMYDSYLTANPNKKSNSFTPPNTPCESNFSTINDDTLFQSKIKSSLDALTH